MDGETGKDETTPFPRPARTQAPAEPSKHVYAQLRAMAARLLAGERRNHTLQPTALVHEAYLRLAATGAFQGVEEAHFRATAATTLRRILIDYARRRGAIKRGGGRQRITLSGSLFSAERDALEVLALDEALTALSGRSERQARVVELRFFAGATEKQVAAVLCCSERTVRDDWRFAKAWLRARLADEEEDA